MNPQEIASEISELEKELRQVQERNTATDSKYAIKQNAKRMLYLIKAIELREKLLD